MYIPMSRIDDLKQGKWTRQYFHTLCFALYGTLILSLFAFDRESVSNITYNSKVSDYENPYSFPFENTTTYLAVSVESLRSFKIIDTTTSASSQDTMQPLITYENPAYEIKIKYPADWQKKESTFAPGNNTEEVVRFSRPAISHIS